MGNETIFYRAEKSTLIYFVTEKLITGSRRYVKPRFGRKIKLQSFGVEDEGLHIITVMIPDLPKSFKKKKLLRLMHTFVENNTAYYGSAEIIIHPEVQLIFGQTDSFSPFFRSLSEKLLKDNCIVKKTHAKREGILPEMVVLLLGDTLFPEEQMSKFSELMQPYFPRINHLTILYELSDDKDEYAENEQERSRLEEAADDYAEELYYEYGLVAQVQCAKEFNLIRNSRTEGQGTVLFFDFGYSGNIPWRAMKAGDIYLDIFSSPDKEALFRRKCMEISYISPRKYLDTVVKSGYDKLVNQASLT